MSENENPAHDQELPDYPWKREESWMVLEETLRPLVRDSLKKRVDDSKAIPIEAIPDKVILKLELVLDEIFDRLRTGYDKWYSNPFTLSVSVPFTLNQLPSSLDELKAACELYV